MTICFCHCYLLFSNIFCCSFSVSSISAGSSAIFNIATMASSTPSSKRWRKSVDDKLTDNEDVDSDVPIGTLLHNRKNMPRLSQTKKKAPAVLTQDTGKTTLNPF